MASEWKYPGSRWWRFDFHVHTPASLRDYKTPDATTEDWLKSCMISGLDCVVVADHNSGGWIEQLNAMYAELSICKPEWFRHLTIFPGVEITISTGTGRVHLLGVFDPEGADGNTIIAVLGQCGITAGFGDDQISTTVGFEDTVKAIQRAGGIAIAAHIDGDQGLLNGVNTLNPELQRSLKTFFAGEFCNLDAFAGAQPELQKELARLAKVGGSDAHRPEEIGRHGTWVKMSRPSIEGLRLALLDHELCVNNHRDDPNHAAEVFILALEIASMHHCGKIGGKPCTIAFHPLFNSIIGGRGTGKSTMLDSIRIAARREDELPDRLRGELNGFKAHHAKKGVMEDETEICLSIARRGVDYRLRWRFDSKGEVLEERDDEGRWRPSAVGDLKERFKMSLYSQKQINALADDPNGLLKILDQSPEVNRVEWEERWNTRKNRFLQCRLRQREVRQKLEREVDVRIRLTDVERDLKQYEERGHGVILKKYQIRSEQLRALPLEDDFDGLAVRIQELANDTATTDFPAHLFADDDPEVVQLKTFHAATEQALMGIRQQLLGLAGDVERIAVERRQQLEHSQWFASATAAVQDYQILVQEYEQRSSHFDPSLYGQWVQQRAQLQNELGHLEELKKEDERIAAETIQYFKALLSLRQELFAKRKQFIKSVIGQNAYVRMELVPFGETGRLELDYRALLGLEESNFKSSILDGQGGLLAEFAHWEDQKIPAERLPELIQSIKGQTQKIASGKEFDVPATVARPFITRLQKGYESQPANLDQLLCWWPEDLLRVKYARDPRHEKFEDLEKGSAGQKAAAILAFLLSHGEEPLIIDQPEDDLDNALIYDLVVKQIHANKKNRQLIIVTHNPNIVVNGDAELVHVLEFKNGQVQCATQGGLEEQTIRDHICDIMEGGREAFDKRYHRITS